MPAAAVIPAPGASACVAAVKECVVGLFASNKGAVFNCTLCWYFDLGTGLRLWYSTARGEN